MKDNIAQIVSNKDIKKIRELFNENYPIDIALALEEVDDDVLKELEELDVAHLTPMDALNTIHRLQNKLKNRW